MRIEIYPYYKEYAEDHCAAVQASIESLKKWFTWASSNYCLCDSAKFIEDQPNRKNNGKFDFAIIDKDDNQFLGNCSFTKVKTYNGEQIASMSYWRRKDDSKRRVMASAAEQVKAIAFSQGIKRIEIDVAKCNKSSIDVAIGIGAKPERDIPVRGGDGKIHEGTRYVIDCPTKKW